MKTYTNAYAASIGGMIDGLKLVMLNMLPNMILAFVLMQMLAKSGALDVIGNAASGLMGVFGLPGEAVTVLLASWFSIVAGIGAAATLLMNDTITPEHLVILLPGMYLLAAQIQYVGRLLTVAGVAPKHYLPICAIGFINAALGMLLARFLIL